MHSTNKRAIFICGPTASGKTAAAISLARHLNTEILSFDSRQMYRELAIGSAPPDTEELLAVKHHFIASHDLSDELSAGSFAELVLTRMDELFVQFDDLILAGGSGLYMKAIAHGFDEIPEVPPEVREVLNNDLEIKGIGNLQAELSERDPEYYQEVDRQNPQRIIRALEVIRHTGKSFSSFRKGEGQPRSFRSIKIGLDLPREELYERINLRVDRMMTAGLEEEVLSLRNYWEKAPLKTVGYDELVRYFKGEWSKENAIAEIKKNTRRYAKRQLTWFRRDPEIRWFHPQEEEEMIRYIASLKMNQHE